MDKVVPIDAHQRRRKPAKRPRPTVVGCIVQARMTSRRFPGKTMALLKGKPVIEHVLDNVRQIKGLHKIIVAVPDTDESEPILNFIVEYGHKIQNFCGSENDVLERYYQAARHFKLDIIMRITGDCPLINPRICEDVLGLHLSNGYDYTSNIFPARTFPKGHDCEVFSMDCLEVAYYESKKSVVMLSEHMYNKEHVTPFMQKHPEINRGLVKQKIDYSHINLCVDVPEDIQRLEDADIWNKPK